MKCLSPACFLLLSGAGLASGTGTRGSGPRGDQKKQKTPRSLYQYGNYGKHGAKSPKQNGRQCTDARNWEDAWGDDCKWYETNDDPGCPDYGEYGGGTGGSARDSCCYCGGGDYTDGHGGRGPHQSYYEKNQDKGCRNHRGDKGSRYYEYNLHRHASRGYCERTCDDLGSDCYGYEYYSKRGRCEIWRVPIPRTQRKRDLDCYVRSGGGSDDDGSGDDGSGDDRSCFTFDDYESIDDDIAELKNAIRNDRDRSHFLGGIVRLAAHDFMDFDPHGSPPMGPDGCFDETHPINAGLTDIWCPGCELTSLYNRKYSHLSRADFWVASANAVIHQASVRNALDLKFTFSWGRVDVDTCEGSGERQPIASGCDETEEVFLNRMGLGWRDAVALMGGHTLGGGIDHQGTWSKSDREAQVFDKQYYEEIFNSVWWPRDPEDVAGPNRDWVTEREDSLMLHTDICLAFDIDRDIDNRVPCCTETDSRCIEPQAARRKCPVYTPKHERFEALETVREMLVGTRSNPNKRFYDAFAEAWMKATTVGQEDLFSLVESCG